MSLAVTDLHKRYGDVRAVDGVTLTVADGERLALLGPSGCGKSTLLRLVAGLEAPDGGAVELDGADITRQPAERRGFGVVFQDYALFPHLDVGGNVAFALVERRVAREAAAATVKRLLAMVGLAGLERRRVLELSGGQQQRVALARALAHQPRLVLLDEPLSNLDEALREELKHDITALLDSLGTQAIYVTHDQAEAFSVADQVAVMRSGRIVQVGAAEELLERPRGAWLARFLGHDNVWEGTAAQALAAAAGTRAGPGGLLLRADLVGLEPPDSGATVGAVSARVAGVRPAALGLDLELEVAAWGGERLRWQGHRREVVAAFGHRHPRPGDEVALKLPGTAWAALVEEA